MRKPTVTGSAAARPRRHQVREKYGIRRATTVKRWAEQYGKGLVGKVIRVRTTKGVEELKKLKERVKRLEALLATTIWIWLWSDSLRDSL